MSTCLKIDSIKIDESRLNEKDCGDILPIMPFFMIAVGHVRSGKSTLMSNLFLKPDFYGGKFDVIILLSPTADKDPVNEHLLKQCDFVINEVDETIIEELIRIIESDESDQTYLMILDDIVGSITQNKNGKPDFLSTLATKYRHVGNKKHEGKLSIFLGIQYFRFCTPQLRNNASAYFLMGNSSEVEIKGLSEDLSVFGGSSKIFKELLKKSKKKEFDFLYLDMKRLRAHRNFEELLFSVK
jgi:hypothetical protein